MSRLDLTVAGVAVLVSVGATLAVSQDSSDLARPTAKSESVELTAQTLGCPESPAGPRQSGTVVAVAPAGQGPDDDGSLRLTEVEDDAARELASSNQPGRTARAHVEGALRALMVDARGSLAPGVSAAAYIEASTAQRSGLEGVRCEPARDSSWFPGIDTTAEARSELVLVNPTPAVAVVSLRFHGPDGEVTAPGATGIPVGAGTSQVIDLAGFAPGLESAAVHVQVTRGLVTPSLHVQRFSATASSGTDWIPAAAEPATEMVVGPTASGPAGRSLVIANPGAGEALVQGRVLDEDGAFDPKQLKDVRVPPGATVEVDLTQVVESSPATVRLTANVPVSAGLVTQSTGRAPTDLAYSSTSDGLVGPATVPVQGADDLTVVLASLRSSGSRVQVGWFDASGTELGKDAVRVAGSQVTTWELPRSAGQTAYVVVTPLGQTNGGLHGVVEVRNGAGFTTLPLAAQPGTLTRPALLPAEP